MHPIPTLRWRAMWLALGWLLVATIVFLSLTPRPPHVDVAHGDKLGHVLAYAMLMFWFAQLYASRGARIGYAIGFVAMGIAIEVAQEATGYRSYEELDMLADAVGVGFGWLLSLPVRGRLLGALDRALSPRA